MSAYANDPRVRAIDGDTFEVDSDGVRFLPDPDEPDRLPDWKVDPGVYRVYFDDPMGMWGTTCGAWWYRTSDLAIRSLIGDPQ